MSEKAVKTKTPHGVQSAETVMQVLSAFIGAEPMPMLKMIADRAGMHPAKVHRYLVSLCRAGYAEQDPLTGRYRLGSSSLRLAFAAMSSFDSIRIARPLLVGFCLRLQQTVVLAVWNGGRPVIAVRETLPGLWSMTAAEGFVLPIVQSSIGNVFGAYMPRDRILPLVETELQARNRPSAGPSTVGETFALFDDIRRRGIGRTTGQYNAGSHSFAAPVLGASGEIAAVLCTLGPAGQFNSTWKSPIASTLRQCAHELSQRLGHRI